MKDEGENLFLVGLLARKLKEHQNQQNEIYSSLFLRFANGRAEHPSAFPSSLLLHPSSFPLPPDETHQSRLEPALGSLPELMFGLGHKCLLNSEEFVVARLLWVWRCRCRTLDTLGASQR